MNTIAVQNIQTPPLQFKGNHLVSKFPHFMQYEAGYKALGSKALEIGKLGKEKTNYIDAFKPEGIGSNSITTSPNESNTTDGLLQCAAITIEALKTKGKQYLAHIHNKTPAENIHKDLVKNFGKNAEDWKKFDISIITGRYDETEDSARKILKALKQISPDITVDFRHFTDNSHSTVLQQNGKLTAIKNFPIIDKNIPENVSTNKELNNIWGA